MPDFFQVSFSKMASSGKQRFRGRTGVTDYLFLRNLERRRCLLLRPPTVLIVYIPPLT